MQIQQFKLHPFKTYTLGKRTVMSPFLRDELSISEIHLSTNHRTIFRGHSFVFGSEYPTYNWYPGPTLQEPMRLARHRVFLRRRRAVQVLEVFKAGSRRGSQAAKRVPNGTQISDTKRTENRTKPKNFSAYLWNIPLEHPTNGFMFRNSCPIWGFRDSDILP